MDSPDSSLPNLGMVGLREAVQILRSTRFCSNMKCSAGLLLVSSIRAFLLLCKFGFSRWWWWWFPTTAHTQNILRIYNTIYTHIHRTDIKYFALTVCFTLPRCIFIYCLSWAWAHCLLEYFVHLLFFFSYSLLVHNFVFWF